MQFVSTNAQLGQKSKWRLLLFLFAQQELENLTVMMCILCLQDYFERQFLVAYVNISIHLHIVSLGIFSFRNQWIFMYCMLKNTWFFFFSFSAFLYFQHQIYMPSASHHTCCGTCQNVSCSFHTENGTQIVYEVSASGQRQKITIMIPWTGIWQSFLS